MFTMPYVIESQDGHGYDIFSRLLKDRVILLTGAVNDETAAAVVAQLLYLEAQDPNKDIFLYINSPGGSVTAGLAILDTMEHISCDVSTIAVGLAASMGAVLLAAGTKGKRRMLPNAEAMIHQPLGGAEGQASDVLIRARHLERTRSRLTELLAGYTGRDRDQLAADMDRDNFMDAEESVAYGLADEVVKRGGVQGRHGTLNNAGKLEEACMNEGKS